MDWDTLSQEPLVIKNYSLLRKTGVLGYIEKLNREKKNLELLIYEAYEIFRQETDDQIMKIIIRFLSEKFIPSRMIFILNEGIKEENIKVLAYQNMKTMDAPSAFLEIKSLLPFEDFFKKYTRTTSFDILSETLGDVEILKPFKEIDSKIVIPILGISGLYGIIVFGPKVLGEEYSIEEIAYIDRLMQFTSIGFQNTIHYAHSVKDPKTNLYNHSFFIHSLRTQMAQVRRTKQPCSILVMDIDKFKAVNDNYGHLAGDEVILKLAETLQKSVRKGELLSRFGGEEFTILLPQSSRDEAFLTAERIRKGVERLEVPYRNLVLKVTISIGVACYQGQKNIDEDDLLRQADQALYQSKAEGRNRSSVYIPSLLNKSRELFLNEQGVKRP